MTSAGSRPTDVSTSPGQSGQLSPTHQAYLAAAEAAVQLLRHPDLARLWNHPSALELMSVGQLAGHLATQITLVPSVLDSPGSQAEVLSPLEHYASAPWIGAPVDAAVNQQVRQGGTAAAAVGPVALADDAAAALSALRDRLPGVPAGATVRLPWNGRCFTVEGFLLTRMLEIVVHGDDLGVSLGLPAGPQLPAPVTEPVLQLLLQLAMRRHGVSPLVRAFCRAERAPTAINVM